MGLEKILKTTESVINFLPKKLAKAGKKRYGLLGQIGGGTLGWGADILITAIAAPIIAPASIVPYVVGTVAAASPALGVYKKASEYLGSKKDDQEKKPGV